MYSRLICRTTRDLTPEPRVEGGALSIRAYSNEQSAHQIEIAIDIAERKNVLGSFSPRPTVTGVELASLMDQV